VNAISYTSRILICTLLCAIAAPAFAQTAAVAVGSTVKTIAPLPLQQSPPQGYFSFKGQQVGTATPGTTYIVVETKVVPTLNGQDTWLQVQNRDNPKQTGWIYTGSDANPYQNVVH
jgi:hypothetical protein